MTKEALAFNEKYGLNLSDSAFKTVEVADQSNDLAGKPSKNITMILKRFFKNPIAVTALAVFAVIIIMAIFVPVFSSNDANDAISTKSGINNDIRNLPAGDGWADQFVNDSFINRLKNAGLVEGTDFNIVAPNSFDYQALGFQHIEYDAWKFAQTASITGDADLGAFLGTDDNGRDIWVRTWSGTWNSILLGFAAAITSVIIGTTLGSLVGLYVGTWVDILAMKIISVYTSIPTFVWYVVMLAILPTATSYSQGFGILILMFTMFVYFHM